ncbi:MAG: LysM peptidoglycan-binding domain-containing protein [Elusimicrobia bacterium]|nr:LysM peptidoglycan-binding domain-containing protein [Elusimicrobiota bacterium]
MIVHFVLCVPFRYFPLRPFALLCFCVVLAAAAQDKRFQTITVKPGDTLWAIAQTYLKDPTRWNELLKHNKLPSADPTVALPGMTLKVPVSLIKESMLAATMVELINQVETRRRETADWKDASARMQLYKDDGVRTFAASRARVVFVTGDSLNVDENSMAILKPKGKDADLELLRGEIHGSQSRVVTSSARITPKAKGTRFSAKVRDDLSTLVQVYTGVAAVEGSGTTLDVKAGFSTEVAADRPPTLPVKLPDTPEVKARALGGDIFSAKLLAPPGAQTAALPGGGGGAPVPKWKGAAGRARDMDDITFDVKELSIGLPVSAYLVQVARTPDFSRVAAEKVFEADEKIELSRMIPPGRYWVRVALVDLLGSQGRFSDARQYVVGDKGATLALEEDRFKGNIEIVRPAEKEDYVRIPKYRIMGRADMELAVTINGRRVRRDESGNFSLDVLLKEGGNSFKIMAQDARGRAKELVRNIYYEP